MLDCEHEQYPDTGLGLILQNLLSVEEGHYPYDIILSRVISVLYEYIIISYSYSTGSFVSGPTRARRNSCGIERSINLAYVTVGQDWSQFLSWSHSARR